MANPNYMLGQKLENQSEENVRTLESVIQNICKVHFPEPIIMF
jgi:hypothetical protein